MLQQLRLSFTRPDRVKMLNYGFNEIKQNEVVFYHLGFVNPNESVRLLLRSASPRTPELLNAIFFPNDAIFNIFEDILLRNFKEKFADFQRKIVCVCVFFLNQSFEFPSLAF